MLSDANMELRCCQRAVEKHCSALDGGWRVFWFHVQVNLQPICTALYPSTVSTAHNICLQDTLADVGGVQTSVAALEEQVREFVKREEYDTAVALLATKTDVEDLQTKTADLQSSLETQREVCESLDASKEGKEAVSALKAEIEALQLALQQVQTGKVDVETVEAVKSELAAAQGSISTLAAQELSLIHI